MYLDRVGINTNDMEATLQFYCGLLGMPLVRRASYRRILVTA